jgi:PASTA domain
MTDESPGGGPSFRRKPSLRMLAVAPMALILLGSVAVAGTITLGSTKVTLGSTKIHAGSCTNAFSWVQRATASASPGYSAPSEGTITSWTTVAGPNPATAALKVWRPTSNPSQFRPIATSDTETVPGGSKRAKFQTAILVEKDDVIGIAAVSGSPHCLYFSPRALPGDVAAYTPGNPRSGTRTFIDCVGNGCVGPGGSRLNVSVEFEATVCKVPKLVGKTLVKAEATLGKAHCVLGTVTKKKSSSPPGTVLSQKPQSGKRLAAGSKVAVVVSRH